MRYLAVVVITTSLALGLLVPTTQAQGAVTHGTVVALQGTPHLWIADPQGILHWAGDTRALTGRHVNWSDRRTVTLAQLQTYRRGDPWLSAGLVKDGDPIYLAKWESTETAPRLLHIQSIGDVELFGINGSNYGQYVQGAAAWNARYGLQAQQLQRATLPAATGPPPPPPPTPVPPRPKGAFLISGQQWARIGSGASNSQSWGLVDGQFRQNVSRANWIGWRVLGEAAASFDLEARGTPLNGSGSLSLLFGQNSNSYTVFQLWPSQRSAFIKHYDRDAKKWQTLSSRSSVAATLGVGREVALKVQVRGQQITAYVNGGVVLQTTDPALLPGDVAIVVGTSSSSSPMEVRWREAFLRSYGATGVEPGLASWRSQAADTRLYRALQLLWIHNVDGWQGKFGRPLAQRGTRIVWGNLPSNVFGSYRHSQNLITISTGLRSETMAGLAATIAHEVAHAVAARTLVGAADCLEEEMKAFSWQAATWGRLRAIAGTTTSSERHNAAMHHAWTGRILREVVVTAEGYQQQCLGRVLPDY